MGMSAVSTATTLLTAEQFERQYCDVPSYELVRGEVIELTAGGLRHNRIAMRVSFRLETWAQETKLGRVYPNDTGLIVERGPDTVRGADLAYFSFKRLPAGQEPIGFSAIPADLVVEIVGSGQGWNEMVEKTGEYLRMGVDRVWLLDPESETLHIYGGNAKPIELGGDAEVRDEAILPGFSCRVGQFFHD